MQAHTRNFVSFNRFHYTIILHGMYCIKNCVQATINLYCTCIMAIMRGRDTHNDQSSTYSVNHCDNGYYKTN